MASRLFFPLIVLISTFGVECNSGIRIKTIETTKERSDFSEIGAEIILFQGSIEINEDLDAKLEPFKIVKYNTNSGYICSEVHTSVKILFKVALERKWKVNLNTFTDSVDFKSHGESKATLDWSPRDRYCFTYGIWVPSESRTIEFYLNFLTNVFSIDDTEILYLNSLVEEHLISSILMIEKDYELEKIQQETIQKVNYSLSPKMLWKNKSKLWFGTDTKGTQTNKEIEETQELIDECNFIGKTCIGNLKCHIIKKSKFKLNLGKSLIELQEPGELYMAFLTKKIEFNKARRAVRDMVRLGTKEAISTAFAYVECSDEKFNFILPNYKKQRLLADSELLV